MRKHHHLLLTLIALSAFNFLSVTPASARFHWRQSQTAPAKIKTTIHGAGQDATKSTSGIELDGSDHSTPVVVAPSSLVDLNSARFGKLEIKLSDASFLDTAVKDLHLTAQKMDLLNGTLDSLNITANDGEFQGFTMNELQLSTQKQLKFDTALLLNGKVLQFQEPAQAFARVMVTQQSLNSFLNAPEVLARLSDSAKKRVPILSNLSKQDVKFGFNFLKSNLSLAPDNVVRMVMDAKLGIGKGGIPMTLSAQTKLMLENGWVNLSETKLLTGGQAIPHSLSARIVDRINSLSKWASSSDDVKFVFTELKVVPDDKLELQGTAEIRRLRFARATDNEESGETKAGQANESVKETTRGTSDQTIPPAANPQEKANQ